MSRHLPPSPIWSHEISGFAVWVNGGLIEITYPDDFTRLSTDEALAFAIQFPSALAEAASWANRWDVVTRTYRGEQWASKPIAENNDLRAENGELRRQVETLTVERDTANARAAAVL
ncbi:hypothetical protein E2F47_22700 [Mycobacterium eburneum]|nr:hypothetical protein [Mycobacterium eburneum]TDH48709.1 hypothetical protein E2F47_22700 [Mycobacterium eburneum]